MKKNVWTKMLSLALVLVCVFSLAACGGGDSDLSGTYNLKTIQMAGVTMDMDQLAESLGEAADSVKIDLVLNSDGTYKLEADALEMTTDGTWKADGSNLTLVIEGQETAATVKDGEITITAEGVSMTFKK